MREFLFASCPAALWILSVIHILFMVRIFTGYRNTRQNIFLLTGIIAFGLFYDALILALGSILREGVLLMGLSRMRYVLHGGLIPLLFPICAMALDLKGMARKIVWIFSVVLMVLGIADGCVRVIGVETVAGICRYASVSAPAWAEIVNSLLTFGTVIPMMIVGILVWIRQKTPHLFLSAFLMFAFSGLGAACLELMFYISMYGEVLMTAFLYLYAKKKIS